MQIPALREALTRQAQELDGAPEEQVVKEITDALEMLGYRTPAKFKPGVTEKFYVRVGQRRADKAGSDAGCPDILVSLGNAWLGLEVKARTKEAGPSPEQKVLAAFGLIVIVNSASQALKAIEAARAAADGAYHEQRRLEEAGARSADGTRSAHACATGGYGEPGIGPAGA
jgi:hypothetical protein